MAPLSYHTPCTTWRRHGECRYVTSVRNCVHCVSITTGFDRRYEMVLVIFHIIISDSVHPSPFPLTDTISALPVLSSPPSLSWLRLHSRLHTWTDATNWSLLKCPFLCICSCYLLTLTQLLMWLILFSDVLHCKFLFFFHPFRMLALILQCILQATAGVFKLF